MTNCCKLYTSFLWILYIYSTKAVHLKKKKTDSVRKNFVLTLIWFSVRAEFIYQKWWKANRKQCTFCNVRIKSQWKFSGVNVWVFLLLLFSGIDENMWLFSLIFKGGHIIIHLTNSSRYHTEQYTSQWNWGFSVFKSSK